MLCGLLRTALLLNLQHHLHKESKVEIEERKGKRETFRSQGRMKKMKGVVSLALKMMECLFPKSE